MLNGPIRIGSGEVGRGLLIVPLTGVDRKLRGLKRRPHARRALTKFHSANGYRSHLPSRGQVCWKQKTPISQRHHGGPAVEYWAVADAVSPRLARHNCKGNVRAWRLSSARFGPGVFGSSRGRGASPAGEFPAGPIVLGSWVKRRALRRQAMPALAGLHDNKIVGYMADPIPRNGRAHRRPG